MRSLITVVHLSEKRFLLEPGKMDERYFRTEVFRLLWKCFSGFRTCGLLNLHRICSNYDLMVQPFSIRIADKKPHDKRRCASPSQLAHFAKTHTHSQSDSQLLGECVQTPPVDLISCSLALKRQHWPFCGRTHAHSLSIFSRSYPSAVFNYCFCFVFLGIFPDSTLPRSPSDCSSYI